MKQLSQQIDEISLSKVDYFKLVEAYQKIGDILNLQTKQQKQGGPKTLEGIWKGAKINDEDFQKAKESLFKASL